MNVSSYKNVDEESLLQIPGVVYVPQVGKVTVAMLERNLMRLYQQFHHYTDHDNNTQLLMSQQDQHRSSNSGEIDTKSRQQEDKEPPTIQVTAATIPWYGHPLNLYTASLVTIMFFMELMRKK